MKPEDAQSTLLQYDGPDSIWDEIKEVDFRHAIRYIVTIFAPWSHYDTAEAHDRALEPYDFDYRCAIRTIERYAIEVLGCNPKLMQDCFDKYSNDQSFSKDGLPKDFVSIILIRAWSNINKNKYIVIGSPTT